MRALSTSCGETEVTRHASGPWPSISARAGAIATAVVIHRTASSADFNFFNAPPVSFSHGDGAGKDHLPVTEAVPKFVCSGFARHLEAHRVSIADVSIVEVTTAFPPDLDMVVGSRRANPADLDHRTGRRGFGGNNVEIYGRYLNRPGMNHLAIPETVTKFVR